MRKSEHKPQAEAEPRWTEGLVNGVQCLLLSAPEIWELAALQRHGCKKLPEGQSPWGVGPERVHWLRSCGSAPLPPHHWSRQTSPSPASRTVGPGW